jgi:hypothetical protein
MNDDKMVDFMVFWWWFDGMMMGFHGIWLTGFTLWWFKIAIEAMAHKNRLFMMT